MVGPKKITIRAYDVGFGDCFLLIFHYAAEDRCLLVDFGSTGLKEGTDTKRMTAVAKDIESYVKAHCKGVLHGVVATHRHKDHISGFGGAPGKIIEALDPKIVIQPWTEDPGAKRDAKAASVAPRARSGAPKSLAAMQNMYLSSLEDMHAFSQATLSAVHDGMGVTSARKIRFIAADNLANLDSVERLARMGAKTRAEYVNAGFPSKLPGLLPGVKVRVLGPPNLKQTETILKQKTRDKDEFWHFMTFWGMLPMQAPGARASRPRPLFPKAETVKEPSMQTRWFIDRANRQNGHQMLELVRILDKAMNNTSVILLFEVGKKKLLFPGDAQIENWAFSLNDPEVMKLLASVDVYKVGHHGSLNATPKSLWNHFSRRSKKADPDRLVSVVSTMKGKHGDPDNNTEVPRRPLIKALTNESNFFSTEALKGKLFFEDIEIPL